METLSDNIELHNDFDSGDIINVVRTEKVKEFIKELKEIVCNKGYVIKEDEIDKLAGNKLTENEYPIIKRYQIELCVLCNKEMEGFGNNAQPLAEGKCCDECNIKVMLQRINDMQKRTKKGEEIVND